MTIRTLRRNTKPAANPNSAIATTAVSRLGPFQIKRLIDNTSLTTGARNTLIACNSYRLTPNGRDSSVAIGQLDQRSG